MATQKLSPETLSFFQNHGRVGGKIGGKKRMANLSPEERKALAKKAVSAREAKRQNTTSTE